MLAPGEAAGGGHGLDEGAEDVAEAQGDHLLAGVHRLAPGWRIMQQLMRGLLCRLHELNAINYRKPWQWPQIPGWR